MAPLVRTQAISISNLPSWRKNWSPVEPPRNPSHAVRAPRARAAMATCAAFPPANASALFARLMWPTANPSKRRRRSIAGFALTQTIGATITCACSLRTLCQASTAANHKKRNEPKPPYEWCPTPKPRLGNPMSNYASPVALAARAQEFPVSNSRKQVALALPTGRAKPSRVGVSPAFGSPAEACRQSSFCVKLALTPRR